MTGLRALLDTLAVNAFGKTRSEAHRDSICIRCSEQVDVGKLSDTGWKEYGISGVCPQCFADLFPEDEE